MVRAGKPAPDLFLHAAACMGAAPDQCMVFEDSIYGIVAARATGMHAIGFTGGRHLPPDHGARLLEAGAHRVFGSWQEAGEALGLGAVMERVTPR
nr:HAD-IA family hydrolase [Shinella sp. YE25]